MGLLRFYHFGCGGCYSVSSTSFCCSLLLDDARRLFRNLSSHRCWVRVADSWRGRMTENNQDCTLCLLGCFCCRCTVTAAVLARWSSAVSVNVGLVVDHSWSSLFCPTSFVKRLYKPGALQRGIESARIVQSTLIPLPAGVLSDFSSSLLVQAEVWCFLKGCASGESIYHRCSHLQAFCRNFTVYLICTHAFPP